jgi:hypothetical protein
MISINPPPDNQRCEICGKHVSELDRRLELEASQPDDWFFVTDYCESRWRSEDKKLFKDFRKDHFDNVSCYWECKDCLQLSDKEAFSLQESVSKGNDNHGNIPFSNN